MARNRQKPTWYYLFGHEHDRTVSPDELGKDFEALIRQRYGDDPEAIEKFKQRQRARLRGQPRRPRPKRASQTDKPKASLKNQAAANAEARTQPIACTLLATDNADSANKVAEAINHFLKTAPNAVDSPALTVSVKSSTNMTSTDLAVLDPQMPECRSAETTMGRMVQLAKQQASAWIERKAQCKAHADAKKQLTRSVEAMKHVQQKERWELMIAIVAVDSDAAQAWCEIGRASNAEIYELWRSDGDSSSDSGFYKQLQALTDQQKQKYYDPFYQRHCAKPDTLPKLGEWIRVKLIWLERSGRSVAAGRSAYQDARAFIANIREHTALPDLPALSNDPYIALSEIRQWAMADATALSGPTDTGGKQATSPGSVARQKKSKRGRPKGSSNVDPEWRWSFHNTVIDRREDGRATLKMVAEEHGITVREANNIMQWCRDQKNKQE